MPAEAATSTAAAVPLTDFSSWISPQEAILLSAFCAAVFAMIAMLVQSRVARKRATLDMLIRKEWDKDYIQAKREFNRLREGGGLAAFASKDRWACDEAVNIRNTLNDYEMIAVGIRHGILDERVYKRWFRSALIADYVGSEPFIAEVRRVERNPEILSEFERIAERWGAKDGRPNRKPFWRRIFAL